MDSNITSSINEIAIPITQSICDSGNKRTRGLKPFKPGAEWKGNRGGKPKGTIQIKDRVQKILSKKMADEVVMSIISGSMAGSDSKQDRLLKLTGDFEEKAQVVVNNNSLTISEDTMALARALIREKNNPTSSSLTAPPTINI